MKASIDRIAENANVSSETATQTASSSMLIPSVTTHSVDAAIAYVTDAKAESKRVDYVHINNPSAKAIQPIALSVNSDHKALGSRLKAKIMDSEDSFTKAGFTFLKTKASTNKKDDKKFRLPKRAGVY